MVAHLILTRLKKEKKEESTNDSDNDKISEIPHAMNPEVFNAVMQAMKYINEEVQGIDRIGRPPLSASSSRTTPFFFFPRQR